MGGGVVAHPDHPGKYLEELRAMVAPMTASGRRGILGENVARVYRLGEPSTAAVPTPSSTRAAAPRPGMPGR